MLDKSYLWKHLLATKNADIYKLICQLVCAVDIIVETVELMNHIPVLYTYFFFNFWQLVCVGYIIIVTVELMIHISYFFKSDYNVQSYIDSKFDYHGTIGDWFEVSLCFLVVIFFRNHGIETKVVSRHQFTPELIRWADVLFTAGGDGTYLLAASKVTDKNKPLIGINTDPSR